MAAAGCKKASFAKADLDGGEGTDGNALDEAPDNASDVTPPNTCTPETPSQSKGKAQSCSCDRECQTGLFCVDGICCTSGCGETCKACNLPSSLGDCAPVPSGGKPSHALQCVASTPATCDLDGTCDGKGGCRQYVKGTECKAGTCDGEGVTGISTCDGHGKCSGTTSQSCPPYICDSTTSSCSHACTTDSQCSAGHQCVAGRCGKSANGAVCTTGDDCSSGFCVREDPQAANGVCCNVACGGSCMSCNQTGSVGQCTAIPAGLPDPACKGGDSTTCGNTGLCDGFGSCTRYPKDTVCGPSSCSGLMENTPRTCDGKGTCRESQLVDCSPFLCTDVACTHICKLDSDCAPGNQCVLQTVNGVTTGSCGKKQNGQLCANPSECVSSQCVDGVCCENSCAGNCQSCNLPSSPGRCLNVASGAPDPRKTCKDLGKTACSTNGFCDGNGACQSYPAGTECGPQTCVAGAYSPPSTCNSVGQCVASHSRTCNPFTCNGDVCYDTCNGDLQCFTGNYCVKASCGPKPGGAHCSLGTECQSGFCAQGACCDNACTDACMACNLTTAPGRCTAMPDKSPDPQGICIETTSDTCGTTGTCLAGKCAYYEKDTHCKDASCATASSATPASTCDGKGTCVTPDNTMCDPFICASNACTTACAGDSDCVSPNICDSKGSCGLKANGATCAESSECQSTFCSDAEKVCCEELCADDPATGLCKTCKGTTPGTCSYVDPNNPDPKGRCHASDHASGHCENAGTCDGKGACQAWPSGTSCGQASCADDPNKASTVTPVATCDSSGKCQSGTQTQCYDYLCDPNSPSCRSSCNSDSDCFKTTCNLATHNCGQKLGIGDSCDIDTDCNSEHCVAKFCCVNACPTPADGGVGVCGNTGVCDSNGECITYPHCTPSITSCPDNQHQYSPEGNCEYPSGSSPKCNLVTQPCDSGYLCTAGTNYACASATTGCQDDTNCDTGSGYYCLPPTSGSTKVCRKPKAGEACNTPTRTCPSGLYCVDGVCCNSTCTGVCMACNSAGACTPVTSGADSQCPVGCDVSKNQYTTGECGSASGGVGQCSPAIACSGQTCVAGSCQGQCAPGQVNCSSNSPQTCDSNGNWVTAAACSGQTCVAGSCQGQCAPGQVNCSSNSPQTCDASGNWVTHDPCTNKTCVASTGTCQGQCAPGQVNCSSNSPQTCDASGSWVTHDPCAGQTCDSTTGTCQGECAPGQFNCSSNSPQTCNVTGYWVTHDPCAGQTCDSTTGTCRGECAPGQFNCSSNSPQTCDVTGYWVTASACADQTCDSTTGTCQGECAPGQFNCSDNGVQSCDSSGNWTLPADCAPLACVAGTCV